MYIVCLFVSDFFFFFLCVCVCVFVCVFVCLGFRAVGVVLCCLCVWGSVDLCFAGGEFLETRGRAGLGV